MNVYELKAVVEHVRNQGPLPRDQWGEVLSGDDLLAWFGLTEVLTAHEQSHVKKELALMVEAEALMDRVRLGAL